MDRSVAKDLLHIEGWLQHVEKIVSMGGERYLSDVLIQEAGDSLMVKLGEAARRLARSDLLPPEGVSWATAVANRNFIIHQYDQIDRSITWNTLSVSLPEWNQSLRELFSAAHQIVFSTDRDA